MMDFTVARENMIESQVRPNGITDGRIIAGMAAVARENYVPEEVRSLAYMDEDVPLGVSTDGVARYLMEPMAYARLLQLAQIGPSDIVLDIGCGSGYSTAVLCELTQSVVAIEQDEVLAAKASEILDRHDVTSAAVLNRPHSGGYSNEAPFDAIIVNGRVAEVPTGLLEQLKQGGRLVAVVGTQAVARMEVFTRSGETFSSRQSHNATVPELPGFDVDRQAFVF